MRRARSSGVSKIARDITDRRRAQEKQQLLLSEMDHRILNLFAVTSSIVNMSAQSAPSATALASTVSNRLHALARAHALTRTRASSDQAAEEPATTLHAIIETILSPFSDSANGAESRFAINGPDAAVSRKAIMPVALLLHEFATNAAKYGGLSTPGGRIDIRGEQKGDTLLTWRESGGLSEKMRDCEGFGNKLIEATTRQLAGKLAREWTLAGLVLRLTIPIDNLAA